MSTRDTYTALLAARDAASDAADAEQAGIEAVRGSLSWTELCELPAFTAWQAANKAVSDFETDLMKKHFERARKVAPVQYAIMLATFRKAGMTLEQAMVSRVQGEMVQLALGME